MILPWRAGAAPEGRVRAVLAAAGIGAVDRLLPTRTRVDVGQWLANGRLWVACTADEVVLVAAGARPFLARAPRAALRQTLYNAVTAEVVLLPAPDLRLRQFGLAPIEGQALVDWIKEGVRSHA